MAITTLCDLRSSFGTVRDQGIRPTCLAFAVSDAHAAARGAFWPLSVEHLFYHGTKRSPGWQRDEGISIRATLAALREDGQSTESGWPYLNDLPADLAQWSPPATASPVFRYEATEQVSPLDEIIQKLDSGNAVVAAILISERFASPENGVVTVGVPDADVDYHAVVAVGHGTDGTDRFVLIRNSWGPGWGVDGHAWVAGTYLSPRLVGLVTMTNPGVTS